MDRQTAFQFRRLDRESIVIENPGYVRTGKRQMLKGGISDPRNKALMKIFNMIEIGERAGSGVSDIFSVWEQEGWKESEIEEQYGPDRTILTLTLVEKSAIKNGGKKCVSKKADRQLEKIIFLMEQGKEYKAAEIAEWVDLKASRTRDLLKVLTENGEVEAIGSNRNRRYKSCINIGSITCSKYSVLDDHKRTFYRVTKEVKHIMEFKLHSEYQPTGDQTQALEALVKGFQEGHQFETLLGVTRSGKTFTMANVIQQLQKPILLIAHNKTLAGQFYSEFKEFFTENAVEYFVSY